MSAPRKIWVPVPVTDEGPCYVDKDEAEMQWGCTAVAYHHDDVVRELVEALTEARTTILDLKNSRCSEAEGLDEDWVCDIDAALAKIAQEDKP